MAARQAAFSANLVSLAVLLSDGPVDATQLVGEPVVTAWRQQALLWMAQLDPEDSRSMWHALRVDWDLDAEPTRLQVRPEDGADVNVLRSLPYPFEHRPRAGDPVQLRARGAVVAAESHAGRMVRKSAFVQTGIDTRELIHATIPFWRRVGDELTFVPDHATVESSSRFLLELMLLRMLPGGLSADDVEGFLNSAERVLLATRGDRAFYDLVQKLVEAGASGPDDRVTSELFRKLARGRLPAFAPPANRIGPDAAHDDNDPQRH
jgi:hypothetical protein